MPDLYARQTWVNGPAGGTPVNALRLNHVEEGLDDVAEEVSDLKDQVDSLSASGGGGRFVGSTTDRGLVAPGAGVEFFDTTLGYPVWGDGTGWVKADGTAVTGAGSANAPQSLAVALQSDRTAIVTWTAPAGIDGDDTYTLYWNSPAGTAQQLVAGVTTTTYTTAALTPGAVYAIWANAIVDGVQSAPSNTVQFTVPAASGGGTTPAQVLKINGLNGGTGGHWNLGIGYRPSDPEGGVHKDTTWQQLKDGWSDTRYLKLNGAGNGVVLRSYADGGRTSTATKYARDEFRELQSNGTTKATWNGTSGTHTLEGKTKVTHFMAVKPEVVIAQIHDAANDRILITVEGGSQNHVVVDVNGTELTSEPILTGYSTGDEIHWKIQYTAANGGTLRVYIANVLKMTKTDVGLLSSGNYFKVGTYGQANNRDQANSAGDYFEVELRDLVCTHA